MGATAAVETLQHIAIFNEYSDTIIRNNIIDAGVGFSSISIKNISSSPRILNNTLYCGSGSQLIYGLDSAATAIENRASTDYPGWYSNPEIVNNIFLATGENKSNHILIDNIDAGSTPAQITHNSYSGFTSDQSAYPATNIDTADLYNYLDRETWGLFNNAPVEMRTGARDLSSEFTTDIEENTRPTGSWSRGAIQWQ